MKRAVLKIYLCIVQDDFFKIWLTEEINNKLRYYLVAVLDRAVFKTVWMRVIFRAHYRMHLNHQKGHFRDLENDRSAFQPINSWAQKRVDVETKGDISEWHYTRSRATSCCFDWTINHHSSPHSTGLHISNKLSHIVPPGLSDRNIY